MKKTKIYLDTSVIGFLFAEDVPEWRTVTEDLFENYIQKGIYDARISDVVIREISRTANPQRRDLLTQAVRRYALTILETTPEAEQLAREYLRENVIPLAQIDDALHVAIATCNDMDLLVSWNFKHLANIRKQNAVRLVNERNGYFHPLLLTSPLEALYEDS